MLVPEPQGGDVARVSIRTGDGERVVRRFAADAGMEEVYAFVECLDVQRDEKGMVVGETERPRGYVHVWGFKLVSVLPRRVLGVEGTVGEGGLRPSANLVVEAVEDDDE